MANNFYDLLGQNKNQSTDKLDGGMSRWDGKYPEVKKKKEGFNKTKFVNSLKKPFKGLIDIKNNITGNTYSNNKSKYYKAANEKARRDGKTIIGQNSDGSFIYKPFDYKSIKETNTKTTDTKSNTNNQFTKKPIITNNGNTSSSSSSNASNTNSDSNTSNTNNNSSNGGIEIDNINTSDSSNVGLNEFNKSTTEYIDNADIYGKQINDIETKAGDKKKDIISDGGKGRVDRANDRGKIMTDLLSEYRTASSERRKEIKDLLREQKKIANREANKQVALAGSTGYQLSESERDNMTQDVLSKYARNINEAEIAALTQNRNLDNDLKELGFRELSEQTNLDAVKDGLDREEYTALLTAVDLAKSGDKKAKEDTYNFIAAAIKKKSDEELNRGLATKRVEDKTREFAQSSIDKRLGMVNDMLYKTPGYNSLGNKIQEVLEKYPNATMNQTITMLKKMADTVNQKNILSNTIIGKDYDKLSNNEKNVIDNKLGASENIKGERVKKNIDNNVDTKKDTNIKTNKKEVPKTFLKVESKSDRDKKRKLFRDMNGILSKSKGKTYKLSSYNAIFNSIKKKGLSVSEVKKLFKLNNIKHT